MSDPQERSQSRGRDAFSTGRGGLGNIRQASASTSRSRPDKGPDDFSDSRGREPLANSPDRIYSTGRGGAGNIRSPSRDPSKPPAPAPIDAAEREIIRTHIAASQVEPVSTGRGGLGNIASRSRSRGPQLTANPIHSTGRGGAGNILAGDAGAADVLDEAERKRLAAGHENAPFHSTGRGGLANLASGPEPGVEKVVHSPASHGPTSTGRGGAGNIKHST
ncbi:hypothetical protein D9756_009521 [Leucocoprinus leucothites]|uniref:Uncharacterized protein n=1 Tax=Leucocoprinus leucothites TaxID=201217 RepID=A0A8H5CXI0_9AGAR|nr:hypothetical protein D9756_009521 [Leucoagaricus leucothites]